MKRSKNKNLIRWFKNEGALKYEGNLCIAHRAFLAHSAVNWVREKVANKTMDTNDLKNNMDVIKLFLQKKVDLCWENGIINVIVNNNEEALHDESNCLEATNGE